MISLLTLVLAAATLLVTVFVAIRLKTVLYLLQQPVVKKMSPQLRLKPVKLDEVLDRNRNRQGAEGGRPEGRRDDRGPRPERTEGGRPERRDGDRPRGDRREGRPEGERREGDRPRREDRPRGEGRPEGAERREGRPEGDRPRREDRPRGEGRPEGDRPRREDRPERAEGDRPRREDRPREDRPRREFSETRDFAPAPQADFAAPAATSAPLAPRRPLFADNAESPRGESTPFRETPAAENFVGSSSDDLQHGRRLQLKKKPKFDIEEGSTEA